MKMLCIREEFDDDDTGKKGIIIKKRIIITPVMHPRKATGVR